jgi:hypothetical protein
MFYASHLTFAPRIISVSSVMRIFHRLVSLRPPGALAQHFYLSGLISSAATTSAPPVVGLIGLARAKGLSNRPGADLNACHRR